jgi:thymidylate kinase
MTFPLIVLTGLDGSGKDFVAEALHRAESGSHLLRTPTPLFVPARNAIDNLAESQPAVHYQFYLASVLHASALAEPRLESGPVYMVRYLLDTVCYHRALGVPVELKYVTPHYEIRAPSLTIFLDVGLESVRRVRIASRGQMSMGDRLVEQDGLRRHDG